MSLDRRAFLAKLALPAMAAPALAADRKPNIIVIVADDLGYADLGFQGSHDIRSPRIDSIARQGVRFDNGYVTHCFCSPTRAALLTGRYQHRFGHENNMVFDYADDVAGLPLSEVTLADRLGAAGYATGLVGKWHLGAHPKFHPTKRGFREMYGFVSGGHDYFDPGAAGDKREQFVAIEHDGKVVQPGEYLTTALGKQAEAFVRRHRAHPFFLYLTFNAPHSPLQAPEAYLAKFDGIRDKKRRTYAAMVAAMDDSVGRVLDAVREEGLDKDTLIFFLSDNGGPSGNASTNTPLRGTKRTLYEGGIRVPFAVRWSGRLPEGKLYGDLVSSLDIAPTALAAAGVTPVTGRKMDGVDLLPYLTGTRKGAPREKLYWRIFGGFESAVRDSRWKLLRKKEGAPELYDLSKDIAEKSNLAGERPAEVRRLMASLDAWEREMIPPKWIDHIHDRPGVAPGSPKQ